MVAVILVFAFPAVLLALFYQRSLAAELKDSRSPTVISLLFTPSVSFWDVVPSNALSKGLLCFTAAFVALFVLETLIFYLTYDLRGPIAPRASSGMPRVILQYLVTFLALCSISLILGTLAQALLWWLLAVTLSPSQYMPLAAAAAALGLALSEGTQPWLPSSELLRNLPPSEECRRDWPPQWRRLLRSMWSSSQKA